MSLGTTNGTTTSGSKPSAWDSFFGTVASGIGEGLSKIGGEIMPNWAQKELINQKKDQLKDATYQADKAAARVDSVVDSASTKPKSLISVAGIQLDVSTMVLVGITIIGALMLFKAVR